MVSYKQVIILNEDVEMTEGKRIAQACHASLSAYKKANKKEAEEWLSSGGKKIIVGNTGQRLEKLLQMAKDNKLPAYLVKDAGLTQIEPGTKTAVGIGPAEESKIDNITSNLRLIE